MNRVKGKVAIVTGGALGIGRSACILLAREGAKVAITDINKQEGEKLAEYIKQKGGSIINLSSIYGLIGAPDLPPYHASKGAVTLMTKTDAIFFAKDKIRVNSIHPGYIWTPLVEKLAEKFEGGKEEFLKTVGPLHPLGHVGEPDDIGYGIVYLASDESKFMTGSELIIDGGYTAK